MNAMDWWKQAEGLKFESRTMLCVSKILLCILHVSGCWRFIRKLLLYLKISNLYRKLAWLIIIIEVNVTETAQLETLPPSCPVDVSNIFLVSSIFSSCSYLSSAWISGFAVLYLELYPAAKEAIASFKPVQIGNTTGGKSLIELHSEKKPLNVRLIIVNQMVSAPDLTAAHSNVDKGAELQ